MTAFGKIYTSTKLFEDSISKNDYADLLNSFHHHRISEPFMENMCEQLWEELCETLIDLITTPSDTRVILNYVKDRVSTYTEDVARVKKTYQWFMFEQKGNQQLTREARKTANYTGKLMTDNLRYLDLRYDYHIHTDGYVNDKILLYTWLVRHIEN